jgi:dipeptidyl aminopeptidase/acylaminoacyl peptidase
MHGVHDPRVKVTQSLQMAEALRARLKYGLIQGLV